MTSAGEFVPDDDRIEKISLAGSSGVSCKTMIYGGLRMYSCSRCSGLNSRYMQETVVEYAM